MSSHGRQSSQILRWNWNNGKKTVNTLSLWNILMKTSNYPGLRLFCMAGLGRGAQPLNSRALPKQQHPTEGVCWLMAFFFPPSYYQQWKVDILHLKQGFWAIIGPNGLIYQAGELLGLSELQITNCSTTSMSWSPSCNQISGLLTKKVWQIGLVCLGRSLSSVV